MGRTWASSAGYIYIINLRYYEVDEDEKPINYYCKIGFTWDPEYRIKAIRREYETPGAYYIFKKRVSNMNYYERLLHRRFAQYHSYDLSKPHSPRSEVFKVPASVYNTFLSYKDSDSI